jgi:hypothetical protein
MVYSVISASVTLVRLKDARARNSEKNPDQIRNSVHDLQKRWRHIQQATHTLFYIFGVILFLILQNVGMNIGDGGPGSAAYHILEPSSARVLSRRTYFSVS